MNTPDPRWEELRRAVKTNNTSLIKLLSLELNVTYISDNARSPRCKDTDTQEIACSTCKFGLKCGASWSGWQCTIDQFRICKPDTPTNAFLWEQHPDRLPPFAASNEPDSGTETNNDAG